MIRWTAVLALAMLAGCAAPHGSMSTSESSHAQAKAADASATQPQKDGDTDNSEPDPWVTIANTIGKPGERKADVLTYVFPRDDLDVVMDGNPVPTDAGVAATIRFFLCPCGKMNVIGEFCLLDFEINDVIDVLRAQNLKITSVGPFLISSRPTLYIVRFQGEGSAEPFARAVKDAFEVIGPARMKTQPMDMGPHE